MVFQGLHSFYTTWRTIIEHTKSVLIHIENIMRKSFKQPLGFLRLLTTILVNTPGLNSATYLLRNQANDF